MALVTVKDAPAGRGIVVVEPKSRQKAIRAARRHSMLVRSLRLALPVVAVGLLACYGLFMQHSISFSVAGHQGKLNPGTLVLSQGKPTLQNPSYEGFNSKDGSQYTIKAKRAVTDLSEKKPIDLFGIAGELTGKDGVVTKILANEGKFDRKAGKLSLFKGIDVKTSNGMAAKLSQAVILTKKGTIESKRPVTVEFPAGTLQGKAMLIRQKEREVVFSNGVTARLKSGETKPKTEAKGAKESKGLIAFAGRSDEPVDIAARTLVVKDNDKTAQFKGNVEASQGEARLTAKVLDVSYTGDAASSVGDSANRQVNRITAREDVVITRGQDRVVSSRADFDVANNKSVLEGDVVVTSGQDRRIMGHRAEIDSAADTIVLTGRVIVVQGENTLRGSRLWFDQRNGRLILTQAKTDGDKVGRISARFTNQTAQAKGKKPARPSKIANKAKIGGVLAAQSFQTDPSAPVDVGATRLLVNDAKRTATFEGDVRAVQAGFEIRTAIMHAKYSGSAGLGLGDRSQAKAQNGGGNVTLTSITAPGRVVITSKDGQSASGDRGTFNVKDNTVDLVGNVVLKQGASARSWRPAGN